MPCTIWEGEGRQFGLVLNPTATVPLSSQTTNRYPIICPGHFRSAPAAKKPFGNPRAERSTRTSGLASPDDTSAFVCAREQLAMRLHATTIAPNETISFLRGFFIYSPAAS